jgi:hypothetical protein
MRVDHLDFGQFLKNFQKSMNNSRKRHLFMKVLSQGKRRFSVKGALLITGELGIVIKIPRSENG